MTLAKIISMVDEMKPNQYDSETKTAWMSEVEGMVVEEILNRAEGNEIEFEGYDYDLDAEKTLLVPDRYADLYRNYLCAKIDYANAEYERYNNSVTMFEASYSTFAQHYRRTHMPKQPAMLPPT